MTNNSVKELINFVLEHVNAFNYSYHCLSTTLITHNSLSCKGCRCKTIHGCMNTSLGKALR